MRAPAVQREIDDLLLIDDLAQRRGLGVDHRRIRYHLNFLVQYITKNVGNAFRLTADKGFTQKQYNRGDSLSGNSIASFLLGTPSGGNVDYNSFQTYLYRYFAPYFQDDWKVSRRLTLNLGVRWDFNISANERFNRLNRSFDPNAVNPVDKLIDRSQFPALPQLRGGLLFAGVNGVPRTATNLDKWNVQPRIGGAFQISSKLVMRGGWGRYFINPNNDYLQANGFSQSTPLISNLDGGKTPIPNLLNNPFPGGVLAPPGNSLGLETFLGRGSFNFVNPGFHIPYVDQFSFGFQYQLPMQSKLELSYVGSRTRNLETEKASNEPSLAMRQKCNLAEGGNPLYCDDRLPNPFFGLAPFGGTGFFTDPTLSRWDLSRPYPQFGAFTQKTRNDGAIFYNSMQVTYEVRAASGLNMIATYTLSKQIERWAFNDTQRSIQQEGLYLWDRPHRFTVGSVYQLPMGKGRRFLNSSNPILSRLFSGWENNWVF